MATPGIRHFVVLTVTTGVILFGGCSFDGQPRARLGSYATSTPGTNFLGPENLGDHCYDHFFFENNGIVYTCRGGHIDITHLRINADYVRYLYKLILRRLDLDDTEFSFKLNVEPSRYYVTLQYPEFWKTLSEKERERLSEDLALELSQYFVFTMTTWHEILTFYGYKCMMFVPEEPSAFSWEDIYSNLTGIHLGAKAVRDHDHGYNEAMTILLQQELEKLGIQSARTAWEAAEKMRGKWFEGFVLINMIQRNMDIGADDGLVTPILVPGICEGATPLPKPVPTLELFNRHGFSMKFEVEPAEFEKDKILRIVYPDGNGKRIRFPDDLATIMEYTKNEAIKQGCIIMPPSGT
ncbi:MAG: DUF4056 domain-containing protein [Phycisphaerae bacterium]|nr:DUF4056 domain-containing protein [Phycisphaerae bacterium]